MIDVIESLLFVRGDQGLKVSELSLLLEVDEQSVLKLLDEYQILLSDERRGIMLKKKNKQYMLVSKPHNSVYLKKMVENPIIQKLSQAALETLAIIAYKQPVTKVEVSEIRGVNCDGMMRNLLAKALIRECGNLETAGRPTLFATTDEFLDLFNLESIEDLPPMENFKITEDEEHNLFELKYKEENA